MSRLHWHSITFVFAVPSGFSFSQCFIGNDDKRLDMARINNARESAKAPINSVMIGATYLGYMTEAELKGEAEYQQPLEKWEPCNPGCDPECGGRRDHLCDCENARAAKAVKP